MKREVRRGDVSEYSSEATREDIDTSKEEEIEYRKGKLQHSSGNTSFHLINGSDSDPDPDLDPVSLSQKFYASGSYDMKLQACRKLNKFAHRALKRKIFADLRQDPSEEDLKAKIDKSKNSMFGS